MAKSFEATKAQISAISKPAKSINTATNKAAKALESQDSTVENLTALADLMEEAGVKNAFVKKVRSAGTKLEKGLVSINAQVAAASTAAEEVVAAATAISEGEAPAAPAKKAKKTKADKAPAKKEKASKKSKGKESKKAKKSKAKSDEFGFDE